MNAKQKKDLAAFKAMMAKKTAAAKKAHAEERKAFEAKMEPVNTAMKKLGPAIDKALENEDLKELTAVVKEITESIKAL